MARCLVIGANGFIGSHLVDALAKRGHQVRAFGRFSGAVSFNKHINVEIVSGDFLNESDLQAALANVEYVFHFISTTTPLTADNDPLIDIETNIRMSVRLFQLCAKAQVRRIIYASTGGAIYGGGSDNQPRSETEVPLPVSPYGIGKLTVEHYLRYFKVKHGLDSVALRISNPYGERQPLHRKQGVIPIFLEAICKDQPLTVQGDGSMVRDYIYVKDVASMIGDVFNKPAEHEVYNIGSGHGLSINELIAEVEQASDKTAEVTHIPVPATFVPKVVLDTTRFYEEFHLKPATTLQNGLQATLSYIKEELEKNNEA